MSNENPQVTDKRRFADRINDDDVKQMIRDNREEVRSIVTEPEESKGRFERPTVRQILDAQQNLGEGETLSGATFSPSSSPVNTPGMNFPAAIQQVMKGHRVTRLEWENPEIWLIMFYWGALNPKQPAGKYLSIHHADGAMNPLVIGDGDLMGDDWVVVV